MRKPSCFPLLLTLILVAAGTLIRPYAAFGLKLTPKSQVPTLEQISNPKPMAGDILLPMPGGLKMALRPVCIPAGGYLDDTQSSFGVAPSGMDSGTDAVWADRQYKASLNAPFELSDIPQTWGGEVTKALEADPASAATAQNGLHTFLYFIGKYEVTQGQWRAVMEAGENFAPQAGDDRPVAGISWFEATDFTRRYSEWLMQKHPEYLPVFSQERRSSFIRLPTEMEWEYAARGGHAVSPAERERTRLHPAPADSAMSEYIIAAQYDSTLTAAAAVGTRKPNPLGLYDMLGNNAEMVQTPFQLVAAGQLLGNQGGFVIKGGSWRAYSEASLHPGRRVEAAYYIDGAAQRRDDLGFRVSLGTILTPKDRQEKLAQEWRKKTSPRTQENKKEQDVRVLIREVVREVESPLLKQRLAEAEAIASQYHAQVNANEERMMHEVLLGAAFSLETIANYASRGFQLIKLMDAYAKLSPAERGAKDEENRTRHVNEVKGFVRGMQGALFYYRTMLTSAAGMDKERLLQQLEKLRVQFAHDDSFSKNMGRRLVVLRKHLEGRQGNRAIPSEWEDLQDILPDWLLTRMKEYWEKA